MPQAMPFCRRRNWLNAAIFLTPKFQRRRTIFHDAVASLPKIRYAQRRGAGHSARNKMQLSGASMALVKRAVLSRKGIEVKAEKIETPPPKIDAEKAALRRQNSSRVQNTKKSALDRNGVASQELASGVTEAAAAAEELRRAVAQISTAAEEGAGAAQQSLAAISALSAQFVRARNRAELARDRTNALHAAPRANARKILAFLQRPRWTWNCGNAWLGREDSKMRRFERSRIRRVARA